VDVYYGKILDVTKRLPSRKGANLFKVVPQGCTHWDDPDASFLCRWFKPVMQHATCLERQQTSLKRTLAIPVSKPQPVRFNNYRSFSLPITCDEGFNWPVNAWDGRILCIANMTWDTKAGSYLLHPSSQKLANAVALKVTGDKYTVVGEQDVRRARQGVKEPKSPLTEKDVETINLRRMEATEEHKAARAVRAAKRNV
jgi:hypothetical protein